MQSDAELVRQVREGGIESYGVLVERYERLIRFVTLKISRDQHLADDFVQDAFVHGLEKLDSLQDPAKLSEESEHLMELVGRLSETEQLVLSLRYLNGHSVQEIAAITDRRVGTVTKQLSRAYKRLRNSIQKESKRE